MIISFDHANDYRDFVQALRTTGAVSDRPEYLGVLVSEDFSKPRETFPYRGKEKKNAKTWMLDMLNKFFRRSRVASSRF